MEIYLFDEVFLNFYFFENNIFSGFKSVCIIFKSCNIDKYFSNYLLNDLSKFIGKPRFLFNFINSYKLGPNYNSKYYLLFQIPYNKILYDEMYEIILQNNDLDSFFSNKIKHLLLGMHFLHDYVLLFS